MYESNYRDQEPSAVQNRETDGCPICEASILIVERRGPSDVVVPLCGHVVGDTLAQNYHMEVDA